MQDLDGGNLKFKGLEAGTGSFGVAFSVLSLRKYCGVFTGNSQSF